MHILATSLHNCTQNECTVSLWKMMLHTIETFCELQIHRTCLFFLPPPPPPHFCVCAQLHFLLASFVCSLLIVRTAAVKLLHRFLAFCSLIPDYAVCIFRITWHWCKIHNVSRPLAQITKRQHDTWIYIYINIIQLQQFVVFGGAGIAQWLERRTRDWKVAGSNPCWNGGRIFFSRVDFLCWLLFRYPFHPRVTTVAHKKSRSFCQKCKWQVTAKHAYTLRMWLLLNRASALVTTCP